MKDLNIEKVKAAFIVNPGETKVGLIEMKLGKVPKLITYEDAFFELANEHPPVYVIIDPAFIGTVEFKEEK